MPENIDPEDPRDILWNESFRIFYDSYYEQILCEKLLRKWYMVDLLARILVALTASGSAIAAWAVWTINGFNWIWAVIAGISALLSVFHSVLNVPSRLKELSELRASYLMARADVQRLRFLMRLKPDFPVDSFAEDLTRVRRTYNEVDSKQVVDVFRTRSMEKHAQEELNAIIADEVE